MIKLFDGYLITADQYNYILKEDNTNNGHTNKYYHTLDEALAGFYEIQIKKRLAVKDEITLAQALEICKSVKQEIMDLVKNRTAVN